LSDKLRVELVKLGLRDGEAKISVIVNAKLYNPKTYSLICTPSDIRHPVKYLCTAELKESVMLSSDNDVSQQQPGVFSCEATWGKKKFTFTLQSRNVQEGALQQAAKVVNDANKSILSCLADTELNEEKIQELMQVLRKSHKQYLDTKNAIGAADANDARAVDLQGARDDNPVSKSLARGRAADAQR
jgi:hypothetical protein